MRALNKHRFFGAPDTLHTVSSGLRCLKLESIIHCFGAAEGEIHPLQGSGVPQLRSVTCEVRKRMISGRFVLSWLKVDTFHLSF